MSANDNTADIRAALDNPADAPAMAQPGDLGPELRGTPSERPPFPPDCPITPLGFSASMSGSQACYYLDHNGQLVGLEAGNRHGKNSLIALFGPSSDWLEAHFPQWSKPIFEGRGNSKVLVRAAEIVGFDQAEASRALIEECVRRGIFDAAGKIRGAGAHRQRGGGLTLHCGDKVLVSRYYATSGELRDRRWTDPGLYDGHVYTAASAVPRPWHEEAHVAGPRRLLTDLLMTWSWKRKLLDPRLLLGGIGASMVGGALRWRPNLWITGGRGTGKSTLNGEDGVLDQLFAEGAFRTGNASAAAIRQSLLNSTVPVIFDEIEASADNRRVTEVIELARIASSGEKMHRGGQDHQAHEFTLRSLFWFSSINIPPLQPQDRSRLAILELNKLPKGSAAPDLAKFHLPRLGRELLARMVEGWERLEPTKLKFHAALAAQGHDNRACDQFGTLLACADILLNDHPTGDGLVPDDEVDEWALRCRPDRLAEIAEETPDHVECLHHILTSEVQARGGDEREVLGSWIGKAVAYAMAPLLADGGRTGDENADRRLQERGIKIVNARRKPNGAWGTQVFDTAEPGFLAVANSHQALAKLFAGTKWQGGVWRQSLARHDGAASADAVGFRHVRARSVLVPLWQVLDEEDLPNASQRAAYDAWLREQSEEPDAGGQA